MSKRLLSAILGLCMLLLACRGLGGAFTENTATAVPQVDTATPVPIVTIIPPTETPTPIPTQTRSKAFLSQFELIDGAYILDDSNLASSMSAIILPPFSQVRVNLNTYTLAVENRTSIEMQVNADVLRVYYSLLGLSDRFTYLGVVLCNEPFYCVNSFDYENQFSVSLFIYDNEDETHRLIVSALASRSAYSEDGDMLWLEETVLAIFDGKAYDDGCPPESLCRDYFNEELYQLFRDTYAGRKLIQYHLNVPRTN